MGLASPSPSSAATPSVNPEAAPVSLTPEATAVRVQRPVARPVARPVERPVERAQTARTSAALRPVAVESRALAPVAEAPALATPALRFDRPTVLERATAPATTVAARNATGEVGPHRKIGAPYQAKGVWYIPAHEPDYVETGEASWYGRDFHGRPTANGEIFDMHVATAAHPTLPLPSLVEVTNLENGRSLVVRVNDRGPFVSGRLIDLSARGAELLGFRDAGSTQVRVRYVGAATTDPLVTLASLSPVDQRARPVRVARAPQTPATPRATTPAPTPAPARAVASRPSTPAPATNVEAAAVERPGRRAATAPREIAEATRANPVFLQVAAFQRRENAERAAKGAGALGPARVVETAGREGVTVYRVVLGPVSGRRGAETAAGDLADLGFEDPRLIASID
jgi:rare lipoprotein A